MRLIHLLVSVCSVAACGFLAACGGPQAAQAPAKVQLGEPGHDVDPEVIGVAVRANAGRFQQCYESAREANPSLQGLIEVRFLINTDGTVGQAMAAETDLPSPVADCVVNAFYGLVLPEQKSPAIAQYPMFFNPG
jgi:hypothetical protein